VVARPDGKILIYFSHLYTCLQIYIIFV
jgi:hypothetical protein